jgi:hypothetical protein
LRCSPAEWVGIPYLLEQLTLNRPIDLQDGRSLGQRTNANTQMITKLNSGDEEQQRPRAVKASLRGNAPPWHQHHHNTMRTKCQMLSELMVSSE